MNTNQLWDLPLRPFTSSPLGGEMGEFPNIRPAIKSEIALQTFRIEGVFMHLI